MNNQAESLSSQSQNESECVRTGAVDRRSNSFRTLAYSLIYNRRQTPRREIDASNGCYYVDVHETKLFIMAIAAILLCVADAFFTLTLLNYHGSEELNPVMDYLIKEDTRQFFIVKFSLTAAGVIFLVAHKNFKLFNRISGYQILTASLVLYAMLVCYELAMLVVIPFATYFF